MGKPLSKNEVRASWVEMWEKPISPTRKEEIDILIKEAVRSGFRDARIRLEPEEVDSVRIWYTDQGFTCTSLRFSGLSISGWTDDTPS